MSETEVVTVGRALPALASVEPANGPFSVAVTWAAGSRVGRTDIVDLAPTIFTFKVFRSLRDDPKLFKTVRVGEWGATIVWDGNEDLEIGAEAIEEMAEEAMSNSDFTAFMKRHGLTLDAAAAQIGISRRLVAYYAKNREVPRYIALACRYLDGMLSEGAKETEVPIRAEEAIASVYSRILAEASSERSSPPVLNPEALAKWVLFRPMGSFPRVPVTGTQMMTPEEYTKLYLQEVEDPAGAELVKIGTRPR